MTVESQGRIGQFQSTERNITRQSNELCFLLNHMVSAGLTIHEQYLLIEAKRSLSLCNNTVHHLL